MDACAKESIPLWSNEEEHQRNNRQILYLEIGPTLNEIKDEF